MSLEDNVAVTALIISIIALFITVFQLANQIFGTGEGYRRCQDSVIGPWAKETRLKWRKAEWRFETRYRTPHLTLSEVYLERIDGVDCVKASSGGTRGGRRALMSVDEGTNADGETSLGDKETASEKPALSRFSSPATRRHRGRNGNSPEQGRMLLDGSAGSRIKTMTPNPKDGQEYFFDNPDLADWLSLLYVTQEWSKVYLLESKSRTQNEQENSRRLTELVGFNGDNRVTVPAVTARTRSWDLVHPDVVKPLATSTVGDIIVLVHRIRMRWTELDPTHGTMRAEGESGSITSTEIRGLGLVLTFSSLRTHEPKYTQAIVPSVNSDKMACGILPANPDFNTEDYHLHTIKDDLQGVDYMLGKLGVDADVRDQLMKPELIKQMQESRTMRDVLPGVIDIVPLLAPFIPLRECRIYNVMSPFKIDFTSILYTHPAGPIILHGRLRLLVNGDSSKQWVKNEFQERPFDPHPKLQEWLGCLDYLKDNFPYEWYYRGGLHVQILANPQLEELVEYCRQVHESTTQFLKDLESSTGFKYTSLIAAHVNVIAKNTLDPERDPRKKEKKRNLPRAGIKGTEREHIRAMYGRIWSFLTEWAHQYADLSVEITDEFFRLTNLEEDGELTRQNVEAAWWTMIVRAIVWTFSVRSIRSGRPKELTFGDVKEAVAFLRNIMI